MGDRGEARGCARSAHPPDVLARPAWRQFHCRPGFAARGLRVGAVRHGRGRSPRVRGANAARRTKCGGRADFMSARGIRPMRGLQIGAGSMGRSTCRPRSGRPPERGAVRGGEPKAHRGFATRSLHFGAGRQRYGRTRCYGGFAAQRAQRYDSAVDKALRSSQSGGGFHIAASPLKPWRGWGFK